MFPLAARFEKSQAASKAAPAGVYLMLTFIVIASDTELTTCFCGLQTYQ